MDGFGWTTGSVASSNDNISLHGKFASTTSVCNESVVSKSKNTGVRTDRNDGSNRQHLKQPPLSSSLQSDAAEGNLGLTAGLRSTSINSVQAIHKPMSKNRNPGPGFILEKNKNGPSSVPEGNVVLYQPPLQTLLNEGSFNKCPIGFYFDYSNVETANEVINKLKITVMHRSSVLQTLSVGRSSAGKLFLKDDSQSSQIVHRHVKVFQWQNIYQHHANPRRIFIVLQVHRTPLVRDISVKFSFEGLNPIISDIAIGCKRCPSRRQGSELQKFASGLDSILLSILKAFSSGSESIEYIDPGLLDGILPSSQSQQISPLFETEEEGVEEAEKICKGSGLFTNSYGQGCEKGKLKVKRESYRVKEEMVFGSDENCKGESVSGKRKMRDQCESLSDAWGEKNTRIAERSDAGDNLEDTCWNGGIDWSQEVQPFGSSEDGGYDRDVLASVGGSSLEDPEIDFISSVCDRLRQEQNRLEAFKKQIKEDEDLLHRQTERLQADKLRLKIQLESLENFQKLVSKQVEIHEKKRNCLSTQSSSSSSLCISSSSFHQDSLVKQETSRN